MFYTESQGITHSICTLEFEDHRPLYDWGVRELEYPMPPRQIEFAKLYLTNVVTGKRYIKKLVEDGVVDGWDAPRLVSIAALRRRGLTPESIKKFVDLCGVSKANSSVDYAMLEYCIREDLKLKKARTMAVLNPVKLVIDNYPEGQSEELTADNHPRESGAWQPSGTVRKRTVHRARRLHGGAGPQILPYVPGQ